MRFTLTNIKTFLREMGYLHPPHDIHQIRDGATIELEHGTISPETNITDDDPILTIKIALAHLNEDPEYYIKLKKLSM